LFTFSQLRDRLAISYDESVSSIFTIKPSQLPAHTQPFVSHYTLYTPQPRCTHVEKASPYSISEHMVLELIPVLGSQPAGDVSHKPGGRLPLLSARLAVTPATLKSAAANFAAG